MMAQQSGSISRAPRPSSLADVLDLILDKGLVIDAYVRVSVVGIEILTIDARVVVASVDTYLRFAEAVNRLDLRQTETAGLKELFQGNGRSDGHDESAGSHDRGDADGGSRDREGASGAPGQADHGDRRQLSGGTVGAGAGRAKERGIVERLTDRGRWS